MATKIQNDDIKSEAELIAAGATKAKLPNAKKIYVEANGINDTLDNAITNGLIGGGSGLNFLSGNDANFSSGLGNWTRYKNTTPSATPEITPGGTPSANLTVSANTTNALYKGHDMLWVKSGTTSVLGEGMYLDFIPDKAFSAQAILGQIYALVASGYASGDITFWYRDLTAGTAPQQVTPYQLLNSSLVQKFIFEFQNPLTLTSGVRLYLHVSTSSTANWTAQFCLPQIGPKVSSVNTTNTDPVDYTPTLANFGNGGSQLKYWREGKYLLVSGILQMANVSPTDTISFTLPAGLSMNYAALKGNALGVKTTEGYAQYTNASGLVATAQLSPLDGTHVAFLGSAGYWRGTTNNQPVAPATGHTISVFAKMPIEGWSAGTEISTAYTGRDISFRACVSGSPALGNSLATVIFNNKKFDKTNSYNSATGVWTCPEKGTYLGYYQLATIQGATPSSGLFSCMFVNSSPPNLGYDENTASLGANKVFTLKGWALMDLNAGDQVAVYGQSQVTNSTLDGTATAESSYFGIVKMQAPNQILASEKVVESWYGTSGGQTLGTLTTMTVQKFINKTTSTHGWYNPSTGIFTAGRSGLLKVSGCFYTDNNVNGVNGKYVAVGIGKNGANQYTNQEMLSFKYINVASDAYFAGGIFSLQIYAQTGDTFALRAGSDNTSTINAYSSNLALNNIQFVME